MPTSIRANSVSGVAEILHADSGLYVQAAALMQVIGGLEVALSTAQANSLTSIANSAVKLNDLDAKLLGIDTKINAFNQAISAVNVTGFTGVISAITSKDTAGIQTVLTNVNASLTALNSTVTGYGAQFNLIKDYTAQLASLSTKLDDVKVLIAALTASLQSPSNMVCQTLDLAQANTQYAITIPAGTSKIAFGCRNDRGLSDISGDIRYSMVDQQVQGVPTTTNNYAVLASSFTEEFPILVTAPKLMYFASATAGTKLLFRRWA